MIVTVAGTNGLITPEFVEATGERIIKNSKVLLVQLEIPLESTFTTLKLAKKSGVTTIFNAAPAVNNIPKDLFPLVDIICVNEPEVCMFSLLESVI